MANGFDHTATPWIVGDRNEYGDRYIMPAAERNWLGFAAKGAVGEWPSDANARRIVAAVNATADIPIKVLELMAAAAQKHREQQIAETEAINYG